MTNTLTFNCNPFMNLCFCSPECKKKAVTAMTLCSVRYVPCGLWEYRAPCLCLCPSGTCAQHARNSLSHQVRLTWLGWTNPNPKWMSIFYAYNLHFFMPQLWSILVSLHSQWAELRHTPWANKDITAAKFYITKTFIGPYQCMVLHVAYGHSFKSLSGEKRFLDTGSRLV